MEFIRWVIVYTIIILITIWDCFGNEGSSLWQAQKKLNWYLEPIITSFTLTTGHFTKYKSSPDMYNGIIFISIN
jgi:hypothetical protein